MDGEPRGSATAHGERQFSLERMGALSDGIFAIVLTLLVLELHLPEHDQSILLLMREDWRVFIAWLISFVLLARFWLVHHAITATLQSCRTTTLALNFGVLGAVSLIPFSADIIGTSRVTEPWSTVVFAANVALLSLSMGLLARHVAHEPHLRDPDGTIADLVRSQVHHLYVLPLVAATACLLAFAHPFLSVGVLLAEFLFFVWRGTRPRPHRAAQPTDVPALRGTP